MLSDELAQTSHLQAQPRGIHISAAAKRHHRLECVPSQGRSSHQLLQSQRM